MELVSTDVPSPRKLFPLPFQRKIHICGLMRSVGLFSLAKMFGEKVDLFLSVLSTRETWFSKHTGLGKVKCLQDKKTVEPRCRAARGMCGHCFFLADMHLCLWSMFSILFSVSVDHFQEQMGKQIPTSYILWKHLLKFLWPCLRNFILAADRLGAPVEGVVTLYSVLRHWNVLPVWCGYWALANQFKTCWHARCFWCLWGKNRCMSFFITVS